VEGPTIQKPLHPQIRSHIRINSATFLGHPGTLWQMKIKASSRAYEFVSTLADRSDAHRL
jgi:hypothetical protein